MRSRFAWLLVAAVACSTAIVACRDEGDVLEPDPDVTLTDAQSAAILRALNVTEVEQGQLALERVSTPAVRDFARRMVDEHGAALEREAALYAQLGIQPAGSAIQEQLDLERTNELENLRAQTGLGFDRVYVDLMVENHAQAIRVIDTVLFAEPVGAELAAESTTVREMVQEHLAQALALQGDFGADAAVPPPDAQPSDAVVDAVTSGLDVSP